MKTPKIQAMNLNIKTPNFNGVFSTKSDKKCRVHKPKKHRSFKKVLYKYAREFAQDYALDIAQGVPVFAFLSGRFIFGDFLEALIVDNNIKVKNLTISTLSISQENIDSLHNLLVGNYIDNLDLILPDVFYAYNRGHNMDYLYKQLDIDNKFQCGIASFHTKIILMETESGKKIVMHGSANLKSSDSVEQMEIKTDPELYDFCYNIHHEIITKYGTINKSLRGLKLWGEIEEVVK